MLTRNQFKNSLYVLATLTAGYALYNTHGSNKHDISAASVKIVNRGMTSGGTGIILSSTKSESTVLTNDHVCRLLKNGGGLVVTDKEQYQAATITEFELSDLCLVTVADNLGVETQLSKKKPAAYDSATISGHPALMPNVLSKGHFSGSAVIQVMTGMIACTPEELGDERTGLVCVLLGGMPVIKSYESTLVTATIMPGSSGSAVYNSKNQLSGVVFAGSGEFGYAWTVPYEQVLNFLNRERTTLTKQNLSQEIDIFGTKGQTKTIKEVLQTCVTAQDEVVINFCNLIKRDMIWRD